MAAPAWRFIFIAFLALVPLLAGAAEADFQEAMARLDQATAQHEREAQAQAVADLIERARQLPNAPALADQLNRAANRLRSANLFDPLVLDLSLAALELGRQGGYLDSHLDWFFLAVDSHKLQRQFPEQLALAQEWQRRAEQTKQDQQVVSASFLSVEALWSLDRLDEGLAASEQAIRLARQLGNAKMAARLLLRTATTYERVGERTMQLRYLADALTEARASSDGALQAELAARLGYERLRESDPSADELIDEAKRLAIQADKRSGAVVAMAYVAASHLRKSRIDDAEAAAREAIQRAELASRRSAHLFASTTLARVLELRGDAAGAIAAGRKSLKLVPDTVLEDPNRLTFDERQAIVGLGRLLSDLSEKEHSFEQALRFHRLAARVQERDSEARYKLLIGQANYRLESTQRDGQIHELERDRMIQDMKLESSRRSQWYLALIAALTSTLLLVTALQIRSQRRAAQILSEQNEKLRQLDAEKDDFLAIAAHDLKSPLGGIQRACEIIADPQTDSEFARDLATDVVQSAGRMFHLITRLLDLHRLGQLSEPLMPCNISELAHSIYTEALPRAGSKRIELELDLPESPVRALADPLRVSQIIDNLLSNALKFSPSGRWVRLAVAMEGGAPVISVADQGPGIAAEDRAKMFRKFARLSARPTGGEHSSGLGLAIVHAQVEALGGSIVCESEPGQGTRFIVRLRPVEGVYSHPQLAAA